MFMMEAGNLAQTYSQGLFEDMEWDDEKAERNVDGAGECAI